MTLKENITLMATYPVAYITQMLMFSYLFCISDLFTYLI